MPVTHNIAVIIKLLIAKSIFGLTILFLISCSENTVENEHTMMDSVIYEKFKSMQPVLIDSLVKVDRDFQSDIFMMVYQHNMLITKKIDSVQNSDYKSFGYVKSLEKNRKNIYAGYMILNDLTFDSDSNHLYEYGYPTDIEMYYDTIDIRVPEFGKVTKWGVSGYEPNDIDSFSLEMYVPLRFISYRINKNSNTSDVTILDTLQIYWNKDDNNDNGVWIYMEYDGEYNRSRKPDLSNHDFYWYKKIDDNGYYLIDMHNFDFEPGSTIKLAIIRGNERIENINNRTVQLYSYVYAYTPINIIEKE